MAELPGEPLVSGFDYRPASECPEAELSPEAKRRVLAKIDAVNDARRRAHADAHSFAIGAGHVR